MKLSQKIKHIKRHKANKRFAKFADNVHFTAMECLLNGNEVILFVSPKLYSVIESRRYHVLKNIKSSCLTCNDNQIVTIPRDLVKFYNDNELDYIKEWCGIPKGVDIPFTPGSERIEYLRKQLDEETVNQLNNIPLGQFVNPELYMHIDKPIAPDISTLNGVRV